MKTNVSRYGVSVDGQLITWDVLREALLALASATDSNGMVHVSDSGTKVDPIARYGKAVMTDASEIVGRIGIGASYLKPEFIDLTDPRVKREPLPHTRGQWVDDQGGLHLPSDADYE